MSTINHKFILMYDNLVLTTYKIGSHVLSRDNIQSCVNNAVTMQLCKSDFCWKHNEGKVEM